MPLASFVLLFEASKLKEWVAYLSCFFNLVSLVISFLLLFKEDQSISFDWFSIGTQHFTISMRSDAIAKSMALLISFIALLVNIYSTVYMRGEKHYHKYFAYLGLFTFSMLGIVLFNHLLFIYAFWELVGLSSYLLIGFWYQNPQATMASKKAFIINRIGDIGFLVGILMIWVKYGSLDLKILTQIPLHFDVVDTFIGISLFGGCVGKSAQFPLQVWLPEAMYGPTPASALIHAATMVAAGIYFMIRVLPLCTPDALEFVGIIGAFTAFMAALSACVQYDIKRILAYSTISQLGYMVVGISTGKGEVAYLHLFTHAFFKAGLFLCAGAIIHEIAHQNIKIKGKNIDPQDIRLMGGLARKMKFSYWAYVLCYVSAIGLPFSSGFISKDFIVSSLMDQGIQTDSSWYAKLTLLLTVITIFITAFYMTRQLILVFWGTYRATQEETHFHETSLSMLLPMIILGLFSFFFFFSLDPMNAQQTYLFKYLDIKASAAAHNKGHWLAALLSVVLTAFGVLWAYSKYARKPLKAHNNDFWHELLFRNFYINRFYMKVVMPSSLLASKKLHKFDTKVIDGAIDKFAVFNVIMAHILKIVDQYVIDGCYHLLKWLGTWIGGIGSGFQTSKIQNYLRLTLLLTLAIVIYLFTRS